MSIQQSLKWAILALLLIFLYFIIQQFSSQHFVLLDVSNKIIHDSKILYEQQSLDMLLNYINQFFLDLKNNDQVYHRVWFVFTLLALFSCIPLIIIAAPFAVIKLIKTSIKNSKSNTNYEQNMLKTDEQFMSRDDDFSTHSPYGYSDGVEKIRSKMIKKTKKEPSELALMIFSSIRTTIILLILINANLSYSLKNHSSINYQIIITAICCFIGVFLYQYSKLKETILTGPLYLSLSFGVYNYFANYFSTMRFDEQVSFSTMMMEQTQTHYIVLNLFVFLLMRNLYPKFVALLYFGIIALVIYAVYKYQFPW